MRKDCAHATCNVSACAHTAVQLRLSGSYRTLACGLQATWRDMWAQVRAHAPEALQRIEDSKLLVAEDRKALLDACTS